MTPGSFPSPARDYVERELDLNDYCIRRKSSTYFIRAVGEIMSEGGIHNGDLLIVDRAEKPVHGDIVIAEIDGEYSVKRLCLHPRLALQPMNPAYATLYPNPDSLEIFGVVLHFIHSTRRN
ncbi:TPA: translesion error-prone DNA polymerase V autoproteolytic subunit [Klebsiella aerogenes]